AEERDRPVREGPIARRRRQERSAESGVRFPRTAWAARKCVRCLETGRDEPSIGRAEQTEDQEHEADDEDRDFHASLASERKRRLITFVLRGPSSSRRGGMRTLL